MAPVSGQDLPGQQFGEGQKCVTVTSPVSRGKEEPQIMTLYPSESEGVSPAAKLCANKRLKADWVHAGKKENVNVPWKDALLKKCERKASGQTLLWLPGSGRHVSVGPDSYRPFTHITRTLHLDDALNVCVQGRMPPKKVTSFSSIDSRALLPGHPCADLQVLWFGARMSCQDEDEDRHDWYGNVEFAVSASVLLERWKYSFLVEMMTTPTHTISRILLTNTDFSAVLQPYNPYCGGGPWQVSAEGHLGLVKCSRYRFVGTNRHPHQLEFLLDVTEKDERVMLQGCRVSFKNHEEAQDMKVRHVCNRYQRAQTDCPSPFPRSSTARLFLAMVQQMNVPLAYVPKLSKSSQQLYNDAWQ